MMEIKKVWGFSNKEADFSGAENMVIKNKTKDGMPIIKKNILEFLKKNKKAIPWIEVETKADEELVIEAAKAGAKNIIISGKNNSSAPRIALENIVAETQRLKIELFALANSFEEMLSISKSLDIGLNIIVKEPKLIGIFRDYFTPIKFDLKPVRIKSIVKFIGIGQRSCIDIADIMEIGEGMLIGSTCKAFFLVHAEIEENEFTPSRKFRVNAGGIHGYIITGYKNDRIETKYLEELKSGLSKVLVVDKNGNARKVLVGRNKIEPRTFSLITIKSGQTILLQEAETICLTLSNGKPKSILFLQPGDEVLMYFSKGGMHGGIEIEEGLIEH